MLITYPIEDVSSAADNGWSPVFAVVTDGARSVLQVTTWTGGTGSAPASGKYVGAAGLVTLIADAVDVRGGTGATGSVGPVGDLAWHRVTGTLDDATDEVELIPYWGPAEACRVIRALVIGDLDVEVLLSIGAPGSYSNFAHGMPVSTTLYSDLPINDAQMFLTGGNMVSSRLIAHYLSGTPTPGTTATVWVLAVVTNSAA